jgi:hypothetical protein
MVLKTLLMEIFTKATICMENPMGMVSTSGKIKFNIKATLLKG